VKRRSVRRVAAAAALALACVVLAPGAVAERRARRFVVGADVSSLPRVEAAGATFRDRGASSDALMLLRRAGFNAVRLRVWHSPADGACDLASTSALARRARALGMDVMLDLHVADTWADPGHQPMPAAWRGLAFDVLVDSVHAYTRDAVAAVHAAAGPLLAVQIGNEIDGGMLWDAGRVGGAFDTPQQWRQLAALLAAAARGVRDAAPGTRIVVHLARGGDVAACRWFFDHLADARVDYDVIAVSCYPWWHGSLAALRANLAALAARYDRDVMVVETAYPWTLAWFDAEHNLVGAPSQTLPVFPPTPAGQAAFARAVRRAVEQVPHGRGAGVWWWEPAWTAAPRAGSPWENCALFDSSGALLPAARAFAR